jgi:hypothetical protein
MHSSTTALINQKVQKKGGGNPEGNVIIHMRGGGTQIPSRRRIARKIR